MLVSELLHLFEEYLTTEKKASANTESSYLRDMHQFETAMAEQDLELTELAVQDVELYVDGLTRKGKSAATVTRSIASIKSFYNCMIALGIMDRNPAKDVVAAKVERKLPQILTGKEVELFLEQPDCSDLKGFRDRAMLELLYATGIRVSAYRPGPGRPESARRGAPLRKQGAGANHPPVPHRDPGAQRLHNSGPASAGGIAGGDRSVCQHER